MTEMILATKAIARWLNLYANFAHGPHGAFANYKLLPMDYRQVYGLGCYNSMVLTSRLWLYILTPV